MSEEKVLFTYLHDQRNPRRIVTLARVRDSDTIDFAWAINRVSADQTDNFTKKRGREIAYGRLARGLTLCASLQPDSRPLESVLNVLVHSAHTPPILRRIAQENLEAYQVQKRA